MSTAKPTAHPKPEGHKATTANPGGIPAATGNLPAAKPKKVPAAPQAFLPPIVHDFTPLLSSPPKNATDAELKNIVALVSTDKNHSFLAAVTTLAPDYARVANPAPPGETPVSVLIGSKEVGKVSIVVGLSAAEVKKSVSVPGDFSVITKVSTDVNCSQAGGCAVLLAADGETVIGQVTDLRLSPDQALVSYAAAPAAAPVWIRIQDAAAHNPVFAFSPGKFPTTETRQVIAGDFCHRNELGICTSVFFSAAGAAVVAGCGAEPKCWVTGSYVVDAGNSAFYPARLNALGSDSADIIFSAPANFKPGYLVLDAFEQSYRFAYTPAPPMNTSDINYESDELSTICNTKPDPLDATNEIPDCSASTFSLASLPRGSEPHLVAIQGNLIVARVTAAAGEEPPAIVVTKTGTKSSVIARQVVKPGGDSKVLNVNMSIMDQVTAQRNYGNRIAKRYIAVTLDVKNPTSTKVQFNKSAMYFDVDYVEAREQGLTKDGFFQGIAMFSTLGLYQPSVYAPPFVEGQKLTGAENEEENKRKQEAKREGKVMKKPAPRVARFGLEQNVKQSPENYLSVLGSFDYTTTKTDEKLKALELLGSVLTTIATGGIVADASGAFKSGTALFSGTFLPGVRGIALDTSFINRLRSNLVAQTLQETIQVPAKGSTTTIVLLPRAGILGFTDIQVPVMIKRIIDVHLVEEVVSPVAQTSAKKNECPLGSTKEQTKAALGDASGMSANPDGTSSSTYSKGPIPSISFDKNGIVSSCGKPRTNTEQMDLAKTLIEAKQTLSELGITATQIQLTDGSTVLVDIPGIDSTYHFDAKGNITTPYTFLFKEITAEEGKSQTDFQTFLETKAAALSTTRSSAITTQSKNLKPATAGSSSPYLSPDIENGSMTVTFENTGAGKAATIVVDKITFQGDRPKSIN